MRIRTIAILCLVGLLTVTSSVYSVNAATLYLEDGFETGFSNWDGYRTSRGETLGTSSYRSFTGAYSAVASSNGGGGVEYSYCCEHVSSSVLYVRALFYVARSGIVQDGDRIYFITFMSGQTTLATVGWRMINGETKWFLLLNTGDGWVIDYSDESAETGKWYEVRLYWKEDAANGGASLEIGGHYAYPREVCAISNKNTAAYGYATQVRVGLPTISYCGRTIAYFDEVVMDDEYDWQYFSFPNIFYDYVTLLDYNFESGFNEWSGVRTYNGGHASVVNGVAEFYVDRSSSYGQAYCFKNVPAGIDTSPYANVFFMYADFKVTNCRLGYNGRIYLLRAWRGNDVVLAVGWERTSSGLRWFVTRTPLESGTTTTHYSDVNPELNTLYSMQVGYGYFTHTLRINGVYVDDPVLCNYGYGLDRIDVGLAQTSNCRTASVSVDNFSIVVAAQE
jgi:hypothetical protein